MAKAPAFQFFVRDWMCSRKVTTMSGNGVKAYMYLLCEAWLQEPRATLPQDDSELASMARLSDDEWEHVKDEVLKCFEVGTCKEHSGRLYSERLLSISRKYDANQRVGNKNARKRQPNAKKRLSSSSSSSISSSTSDATFKEEEKKGFGTLPRRIVEYLNNALSSSFKYQSKTTQAHIKARIREGFTEHDFYKVIDFKASQWGSDPKMQEYLRPNTLFGPKMEGYLQSAGSYRPDADSFDDRKRIEERDAKIQAECDEIKREVGLL